ncbi:peptide chain release factor N(5)-glutamine methyltransferase [Merdimonas faecis]|uniref:Release factor glutamine methyltransferase n=1 Tax=Merdimonas faecis TaxID=1653435 RepID=A0A9D2VVT3_9FIRM|nr:peptide chain release factor N(5)-glutamine methyltransferase [Merdimonas faecis]HJH48838.1 peptide chain release factor N(5)-glutamine methyltransferase [Merdimonas faecis]
MSGKILTLQMIYKEGAETLEHAGIPDAKLDAWYLLEYVTGISRASYFGDPKREVPKEQAESYREVILRRAGHIPLQHITGEQEFMGYTFLVNPDVLIPRQDTETLTEEALKFTKPGMKVLDMCTGSGCILISLLKSCPGLKGTGCDISEKALKMARENGRRLQVEASWIQSDLFEQISERFDLIVSNPPYIRTGVIEELQEEVRLHDPWIALDGKKDGLYFYRRIIAESTGYIRDNGAMMFEIGHDQAEDVVRLMEEAGYTQIRVKKDLAGLDRVVTGRYNKR